MTNWTRAVSIAAICAATMVTQASASDVSWSGDETLRTYTNALGHSYVAEFDSSKRVTSLTDPNGIELRTQWASTV